MAVLTRRTLPIVDALAVEIEYRGISARRAAELLGVSHQTVPNWLKGNTTPPLNAETQAAFARFLDVSPREVVELFELDLSGDPIDSADVTGPYLSLAA